jgi:triacylglycerol esterase/lipase EstA (alpha/beta hydrolase family)
MVDFVGHSQGGVLPRYWYWNDHDKRGDAYGKIRTMVGIAAVNQGTTMSTQEIGLKAMENFFLERFRFNPFAVF